MHKTVQVIRFGKIIKKKEKRTTKTVGTLQLNDFNLVCAKIQRRCRDSPGAGGMRGAGSWWTQHHQADRLSCGWLAAPSWERVQGWAQC